MKRISFLAPLLLFLLPQSASLQDAPHCTYPHLIRQADDYQIL